MAKGRQWGQTSKFDEIEYRVLARCLFLIISFSMFVVDLLTAENPIPNIFPIS